jgi:hypothetical protein
MRIAAASMIMLVGCRAPAGADAAMGTDGTGDPQADTGDAGDGSGEADTGETGEPDDDACAETAATPLRRLTATEYANSVRDLLGVDASDLVAAFPADAAVNGFSNNAAAQAFLLSNARAYQDAAEAVASRFATGGDSAIGCTPTGSPEDPCLRGFIGRFASAAFRRPEHEVDVDALVLLATSTDDPDAFAGVSLVVRAVLQSPRFLFRIERGVVDGERTRLDGYEIATRLSYFLRQTTPDPWLRERAEDGTLDTADGVAEVAAQMLGDAAMEQALAELARGWLRLDALEDAGRSPQAFPEWSPALRDAMREEVVARVVDATVGEGTLADLWTGRTAWVNAELAAIYGVPAPAGDGLQPVTLPAADDRGGLLGTAAFLAATTPSDITSPVRRGMFVWDALLCSPLPPPPQGVVGELPAPGDVSKAEALAQHRSEPACGVCHDLLDPIGLGLERYDALGRRRALDEGGAPVVSSGEVPVDGGGAFGGAAELGAILGELAPVRRCFATQIFRWSQGRTEVAEDGCTLDALESAAGEDFAALVRALVTSHAFRYRTHD